MSKPFPIIEYAHKIKKNTAEFTVNDLVAFMKWWVKQPVRKDILAMKNEYVQKNKSSNKKVDQEMIDDGEAIEEQEEAQEESAVVAEMTLTQLEVDALKWALGEIFANYDLDESEYNAPLTEMKESLDSL